MACTRLFRAACCSVVAARQPRPRPAGASQPRTSAQAGPADAPGPGAGRAATDVRKHDMKSTSQQAPTGIQADSPRRTKRTSGVSRGGRLDMGIQSTQRRHKYVSSPTRPRLAAVGSAHTSWKKACPPPVGCSKHSTIFLRTGAFWGGIGSGAGDASFYGGRVTSNDVLPRAPRVAHVLLQLASCMQTATAASS